MMMRVTHEYITRCEHPSFVPSAFIESSELITCKQFTTFKHNRIIIVVWPFCLNILLCRPASNRFVHPTIHRKRARKRMKKVFNFSERWRWVVRSESNFVHSLFFRYLIWYFVHIITSNTVALSGDSLLLVSHINRSFVRVRMHWHKRNKISHQK